MKRTITALAAVLAVVFLGAAGCGNVTSGGACDQIGSQHTNEDGTLYTCVKNTQTGKGFWYKGKG